MASTARRRRQLQARVRRRSNQLGERRNQSINPMMVPTGIPTRAVRNKNIASTEACSPSGIKTPSGTMTTGPTAAPETRYPTRLLRRLRNTPQTAPPTSPAAQYQAKNALGEAGKSFAPRSNAKASSTVQSVATPAPAATPRPTSVHSDGPTGF